MYQSNPIDLFSALYHLTYENENGINDILDIQENETIEQVATFERKPNFKCKFKINQNTKTEKEFIQRIQQRKDSFPIFPSNTRTKGKTKVQLNLPMRKDAIFKKQRNSKVPVHFRERIQKLLDVSKKYHIIAPVNREHLSTGNTFTNPVITLREGKCLKVFLEARYLNSMIDESKCNWLIEPADVALTRINGTIFTTADLNSANNQIPLDEQ